MRRQNVDPPSISWHITSKTLTSALRTLTDHSSNECCYPFVVCSMDTTIERHYIYPFIHRWDEHQSKSGLTTDLLYVHRVVVLE